MANWQGGRGRSAGESSVSRKSNRNVSPRNWNVLRRDEGLGSLRLLPFGSNKRRLRSVRFGEGNSLALLRAAHRYRVTVRIRIESNT